jgi:signal transduction histidine kinase/CheY-like chemotaxis protein
MSWRATLCAAITAGGRHLANIKKCMKKHSLSGEYLSKQSEQCMNLNSAIRANVKQICVVFGAFMFMVLVSCLFVGKIVDQQIFSNAGEELDIAESTISSDLRNTEIFLISTAISLRSRLEDQQTRAQIVRYLQELTGAIHSQDIRLPGFLDLHAYIDGELLSGSRRSPPADFTPQEGLRQQAAVANPCVPAFTSPYEDELTGIIILSVSMRLCGAGGKDYGLLALDLDFEKISNYITQDIGFAKGGYGALLSQKLTFLAHPIANYLGRKMEDLSGDHAEIAQKLREGQTEVPAQKLVNAKGVSEIMFFRKLYNGWFLVVATSLTNYYHDLYSMAAVLSALGLIFMAIVNYLLIHMSIDKMQSEEENKEKTSFLARMSHEIRTPLNSIFGISELLMQKKIPDELYEYIFMINQSGTSLLAIVNDILDFSKIKSKQLQLEEKPYLFSSMLNNIINMIRVRIMDKPLHFLVHVAPGIPATLIGDEMRIRQILLNLLSNAAKYTQEGFISLDVQAKHQKNGNLNLVFRVEDSGIGIRERDIKRLFYDFTRFDLDHNQSIEGTGLGLAITRNLCLLMDGNVSVVSEYGKGSAFTATIKQRYTEEKPIASVLHPERKRVLLLENNEPCLSFVFKDMQELGIQPLRVYNIQDCLLELQKNGYEYLFLPSTLAEQLLPELQKRNITVHPVVLLAKDGVCAFRETDTLITPVYSVTIANLLNGATSPFSRHGQSQRVLFSAPSANVLIVDDIPTNLRVSKELVSHYGINVHTCKSGLEAIECVKKYRYDLVFMDHMMPEMDGLEATAHIRSLGRDDPYYANLPVIALTANVIAGNRELFLQRGMNDLLAKPIEIQKLNEILQRWLPPEKLIKASPEADKALEEGEEWAKRFMVAGVNTVAGIRNVGGYSAAYLSILSDFCGDAVQRAAQIRKAQEEGDIALYTILVHALKGAANSIGAHEVAKAALRMEEAGRAHDIEQIQQKTEELLQKLQTLNAAIKKSLQEEVHSEEKTNLATLRLEDLKQALIHLDAQTANTLLATYKPLDFDETIRDAITAIERHVLMFEYDKAVEKIDLMLSTAGK